jgi:hypothetical protein
LKLEKYKMVDTNNNAVPSWKKGKEEIKQRSKL